MKEINEKNIKAGLEGNGRISRLPFFKGLDGVL